MQRHLLATALVPYLQYKRVHLAHLSRPTCMNHRPLEMSVTRLRLVLDHETFGSDAESDFNECRASDTRHV
jgi:hypothetical protein